MYECYIISCANSNVQYVGSGIDFKKHFRIHKNDINTKKVKCGATCHFTNKCQDSQNLHAFVKTQPIEQVNVKEESKFDDTLCHREKYWQVLLSTNSHRMSSYIYIHIHIHIHIYIYIYMLMTRNQCVYVLHSKKNNKKHKVCLTNFHSLLILNHVCEW